MRPRLLGVAAAAAAAEVLVGAGCGGWAWRPRPGTRPRGVRVGGASNPHAAAAASAVHSERHHGGVQFRPLGLPGMGYCLDVEARIERAIYACRFMTFLAIAGSLAGSVPCFLKGCVYVMEAFMEYHLHGDGKVTLMLVEAIDKSHRNGHVCLRNRPERPKWLEIQSVNDLKTKLGHVIVVVLLVGISEKSKRITITSCTDLFCFSASIFSSLQVASTYSPGSVAPKDGAMPETQFLYIGDTSVLWPVQHLWLCFHDEKIRGERGAIHVSCTLCTG